MKIRATEDQALQMAANAVNASKPMGLGLLRYREGRVFAASDLAGDVDEVGLYLDYVQGRMVKLGLFRATVEDDRWLLPDSEPRSDYQSWVVRYPTYRALALSVPGVEIEG